MAPATHKTNKVAIEHAHFSYSPKPPFESLLTTPVHSKFTPHRRVVAILRSRKRRGRQAAPGSAYSIAHTLDFMVASYFLTDECDPGWGGVWLLDMKHPHELPTMAYRWILYDAGPARGFTLSSDGKGTDSMHASVHGMGVRARPEARESSLGLCRGSESCRGDRAIAWRVARRDQVLIDV